MELQIFRLCVSKEIFSQLNDIYLFDETIQSPIQLRDLMNQLSSKNKFLIVEQVMANPTRASEIIENNIDHWVLTLYLRDINEAFIFNSLINFKPSVYLISKIVQGVKVKEVRGIPDQTSFDCGYWALMYVAIFSIFNIPLNAISDFKSIIKGNFMAFKSFIKNLASEACKLSF